mgnify:CR=1 FL=1
MCANLPPLVVRTALHPPRALESYSVRADPVRAIGLSPSTTRHSLHVARRCFDHPRSDVEGRQSPGHLRTTADDVLTDRFRTLHRVGAGDSSSSSLRLRGRLVRAEGGRSSVPVHGKTRLLRPRPRSRAIVLSEHARRRDEGGVLRRWDEHRRRRRRRRRRSRRRSRLLLLLFKFLLPLLGSKTLHRIQTSLLHLIGRFHTCVCVRVRVRPYARSSLGNDSDGLLIRHGRVVRGREFLLHADDRTTDDDAVHECQ